MPNLIELIKRAAVEAVEASKPCAIMFGKVTSVTPLKINVEQKMTLTSAQLILTRNVTDFEVDMTFNHYSENHTHTHSISDTYSGGGSASDNTHKHQIKGRKKVIVHSSLIVNDEVILLRMQGGQKYLVLDRKAK